MDYKVLVREATKLLDKYEPDKQCVDTFTENAAKTLMEHSSEAQKFVIDIVYGCLEHHKLLDVVVRVFYAVNGRCLFKADWNQFTVVCYLAMFHLENLGLEHFTTIVKSLDSSKMYKFLNFFFNVTNLTTWIRNEWSRIYDADYVEHKWIAPLLRWQTEIEGLLNHQTKKLTKSIIPKPAKKYTKPQEFSLTKPKPRPLPAPELIPQVERSKPVPASTYRTPKEQHILEEIKHKNLLKAQHILYEAEMLQFRCATAKKLEKTTVPASTDYAPQEQQVLKDIKQKDYETEEQASDEQQIQQTTPEKTKKSILPTKLNKAAALRERALHDRQLEEELNRLEQLAQGGSDPTAFLQWQEEMKQKEVQVNLEHRKLEEKIRQVEVLQARQRMLELNQNKAQLKKEETAEMMRRYAQKRLQEEKEMKELVQQVAEHHKNSKAAKLKLQKIKQRIVKEVSKESRTLLQEALDKAQTELTRKFELICQIRAVESVPHIKQKFVDDTETGGYDLLCEMSLAELRERLVRLQEEQQREQQQKRFKILEEKQRKEQIFQEELQTIAMRRAAAKHDRIQRQEEKRKKQEEIKKAVKTDEKLVALQKKLEEMQSKQAKAKINKQVAEEEVETPIIKKFQPSPLDEHYWLQLERTLENHVEKEADKMGLHSIRPR